jgi:hypothetical protein
MCAGHTLYYVFTRKIASLPRPCGPRELPLMLQDVPKYVKLPWRGLVWFASALEYINPSMKRFDKVLHRRHS